MGTDHRVGLDARARAGSGPPLLLADLGFYSLPLTLVLGGAGFALLYS